MLYNDLVKTLEQHGYELQGSTYDRFFNINKIEYSKCIFSYDLLKTFSPAYFVIRT